MATTALSMSSPAMAITATTTIAVSSTRKLKSNKVNYIAGLNSFGGLKAENNVVFSLGNNICTEQLFAKVVNSLRSEGKGGGRRRGGGALSSTCNAVGEIFKIAAIINGLVLVGVAVGFVLLRIEAAVEESE